LVAELTRSLILSWEPHAAGCRRNSTVVTMTEDFTNMSASF
jgi:hypothetical protein